MVSQEMCIRVINLPHRRDRREQSVAELAAAGICPGDNVFFSGSYQPEFGELGASLSHANLIARYLSESAAPYLMVLEDDFAIVDKSAFLSELTQAITVSAHWQVFLLSHNQAIPMAAIDPQAGYYRVINSQTASGYIVKRQFAVKLMAVFFESAVGLQTIQHLRHDLAVAAKHFYCLDILWKNLQTGYPFATKFPPILRQRASYSDIERKPVDYGV